MLTEPVWSPLVLRPGQEVECYLGDRAARVVDQQGRRTLVTSALPMIVAPAGSSKRSAVSLDLEERESGFVPENPLAPVRFGRTAEDAVVLSDAGISLRPAGEASRVGTLSNDRVFYPSVQTDTDFVVMPVAVGAEAFWLLRSAAAPESLRLQIDAPQGAQIRTTEVDGEPAGVEIVRGSKVLSNVLPPRASDADGQPVPVTMEAQDGDIVLSVPHRGQDVAYPLAVDPVITEEYHATGWLDERGTEHGNLLWYAHNASFESGTAGWTAGSGQMGHYNHQPLVHGQYHFSARRWPGSGDGYIWYDSERVPVTPGVVYKGSFYARPEPGVSEARFRPEILFFDQNGAFISNTMGSLVTEQPGGSTWQASSKLHVSAPANARSAVLRMAWEGARDGQWHNADVASLEDASNWSENTGWTREDQLGPVAGASTGSFAMPLNADYPFWGPGLYVGASVGRNYIAGQGAMWVWRAPADSHIRRVAMWNMIHNFDNSYAFHGVARDVPRTDAGLWQSIQSDSSEVPWAPDDPQSQVRRHPSNGDLMPHAVGTEDNKMAVFGLVTTTDGVRSRGAVAYLQDISIELGDDFAPDPPAVVSHPDITPGVWSDARTGRVEMRGHDKGLGLYDMWLDGPGDGDEGPRVSERNGVCGDRHYQCARDWEGPLYYTRNNDAIPEGTHTVHARTVDAVDNATDSTDWTIKIDRSAPAVTASGDLYDQRDQYLNGQGTRAVTLSASDTLSGIASVDVEDVGYGNIAHRTLDCTTLQCPLQNSQTINIDTSQLTEGRHQLRAITTDQAGNTAASSPWTVMVDRTPPAFRADFMAMAGTDSVSGNAVVSFDAASDPELADESMGSGFSRYSVRNRVNGGPWSPVVELDLERLVVSGASSGATIELEIVAIDQIGNAAAPFTAQAVVTGQSDPCDATANGFPPGCADDVSSEEFEEAPVELEPNEPAAMFRSSAAATRYKIKIGGAGWATIRRAFNSYVIGNARNGWQFDQVHQDYTRTLGWITGRIYGNFGTCGWIQAEPADEGPDVETGCPSNYRPDVTRFADQVNCSDCRRPTPIQVLRPFRECRNVDPTPVDNVPRRCIDDIEGRTTDDAVNRGTYVVAWRYTTNGNRFVLVRDTNIDDQRTGVWVFMDRRAFRPQLCTRLATKKYDCGSAS